MSTGALGALHDLLMIQTKIRKSGSVLGIDLCHLSSYFFNDANVSNDVLEQNSNCDDPISVKFNDCLSCGILNCNVTSMIFHDLAT